MLSVAGKPDNCEVAFNFLTCGLNVNERMVSFYLINKYN